MSRWIVGLLVVILSAQLWLSRQLSEFRTETARNRQQQEYNVRQTQVMIDNLAAAMRKEKVIPDWLTKPLVTVAPDPNCRDSRVTATWNLTEWTPGTKARMQYRRGAADPWAEAQVQELGAQSYAATIPIPEGPALDWRLTVSTATRPGPNTVYWPPETQQFRTGFPAAPALQYRIVADGPGGSRATAPLPVELGPQLTVPASVSVQVTERTYQITVDTAQTPVSPCVFINKLTATPIVGDRPLTPQPLAQDPTTPWRWRARWEADAPVTQIGLAVDFGTIFSRTVMIDLAATR